MALAIKERDWVIVSGGDENLGRTEGKIAAGRVIRAGGNGRRIFRSREAVVQGLRQVGLFLLRVTGHRVNGIFSHSLR